MIYQKKLINLKNYLYKMRSRKFGRYGNTDVIKLKPHDKKDLDLEYGDDVDIDKVKKVKEDKSSSK